MENAEDSPAICKPDATDKSDSSRTAAVASSRDPGSRNSFSSGTADDPPKKRRLMTPKARPKKLQEYLCRRLAASGDDGDSGETAAEISSRQHSSLSTIEGNTTGCCDRRSGLPDVVGSLPCNAKTAFEENTAVPDKSDAAEVASCGISEMPRDEDATSERQRQRDLLAASCLKSPPDKRPSSGSCPFGGDSSAGLSEQVEGDGGLGPPPAAVDFSNLPLSSRLESKVVKQRIHGCEEVSLRLAACEDVTARVAVWTSSVAPHLRSLLKDTNPLVAAKTLEILQAYLGGDSCILRPALPSDTALQLLQTTAKSVLFHLLPQQRLTSGTASVLLRLAECSVDCLRELLGAASACCQQLLDERKGNVAAIKGQGLRQLASCLEIVAQTAEAFGSPAVVAMGGLRPFLQPLAPFAVSSDKRVRAALVSVAAACISAANRSGEAAASAARLAVLDLLKESRSLQTEVEARLDAMKGQPLPAPSRVIGGEEASCAEGSGVDFEAERQTEVQSLDLSSLVGETDVLKTVCQQQAGREWLLLREKPPFSEGASLESGLQQQLRQQLRSLIPDVAAKLKVNNKLLQTAAINCIGTFLRCSPLDAVLVDLLPLRDKAPGFRRPLLEQLTKSVAEAQEAWAPHKTVSLLLEAAHAAASDGNAAVRAAGAALALTLTQRGLVDETEMASARPLSDARRKPILASAQQTTAKSVSPQTPQTNASGATATALSSHSSLSSSSQTSLLRVVKAKSQLSKETGASAPRTTHQQHSQLQTPRAAGSSTPSMNSLRAATTAKCPGEGRRAGGQSLAKAGRMSRPGGGSRPCTFAAAASASLWETSPPALSDAEAEEGAKALLPLDLMENLEKASSAAERKAVYDAVARWARHQQQRCACQLCAASMQQQLLRQEPASSASSSSFAVSPESVSPDHEESCALRQRRRAALPLVAYLRSRMRGFRERTALLDEACLSALKAVLKCFVADRVGKPLTPDAASTGEERQLGGEDSQRQPQSQIPLGCAPLGPVDVGVVYLVMEAVVDRLADLKCAAEVQTIASLLADCVGSPVPIVAQLSALLETKASSSACGVSPKLLSACTALLQSLFAKWGLAAFAPTKQFLLVLRQMLEPSKGPRSAVFPLLREVCAQVGEKIVAAAFIGNPLPDDVTHALLLQRKLQQPQPHIACSVRGAAFNVRFEEAKAALAAGAVAAASALAEVSQSSCLSSEASFASTRRERLSFAQCLSSELLSKLDSRESKEALDAATEVLRVVTVEAQGRVQAEGIEPLIEVLGRQLQSTGVSLRVRLQVLFLIAALSDALSTWDEEGPPRSDPQAQVLTQLLPPLVNLLNAPEKPLREASHVASAKCMRVVGVDVCLPVISKLLQSATETPGDLASQGASTPPAHRPSSFSSKSPPSREGTAFALGRFLALVAASLPVDQASPSALSTWLLPQLFGVLLNRGVNPEDQAAAKAVLSLAARAVSAEELCRQLRQASLGAGQAMAATDAKEALPQLLLPASAVDAMLRSRRVLEMEGAGEQSTVGAVISEPRRQRGETKSLGAATPRELPHDGATAAGASGRVSQREAKNMTASSSGGVKKEPASSSSRRLLPLPKSRDGLMAALQNRLNAELFEALFPSGSRGGCLLSVEQLRELQMKWRIAFKSRMPRDASSRQRVLFECTQSTGNLLLAWIASCLTEALQQQQRPPSSQQQQALLILLQLLSSLLSLFGSAKCDTPVALESAQVFPSFLETVEFAASLGDPPTSALSVRLQNAAREVLAKFSKLPGDVLPFVEAAHQCLLRTRAKTLQFDLMASMVDALHVHVSQQQTEGRRQGESPNAAFTDFLLQQLVPRMQVVAADPKAAVKKRQVALQVLALCHLAAEGGIVQALRCLPSDVRMRVLEMSQELQIRLRAEAEAEAEGSLVEEVCDAALPGQSGPSDNERSSSVLPAFLDDATNEASDLLPPAATARREQRERLLTEASATDASVKELLQGGVFERASTLLREALDRTDQILGREGSLLQLQSQALQRLSLRCSPADGEKASSSPSCTAGVFPETERRLLSVLPLLGTGSTRSKFPATSKTDSGNSAVATDAPPATLMTLCAVAALRTWSCELQIKNLARCSTAAQSFLLLLLGSPPLNPQSTAAAAAAVALGAAGRQSSSSPSSSVSPSSREETLAPRSGSSRQQLQLSMESEAVLSSHSLCWHWLLEGALHCLEFCFQEQHFETIQGAALSLQGIVASLIIIEVLTRRRMQRHAPLPCHGPILMKKATQPNSARPLEDGTLLQRSCETLLCCMGRYQGYLYRNKLAADSRFGTLRLLATFLLNQIMGRNLLPGDLRVLSSLLEFCLNAANESLANGGEARRFLHLETLWRLVGKIHRKSAVLLEKYAAELRGTASSSQHQPYQQRQETNRSASLSGNPALAAEAQLSGVLALIKTVVEAACTVESCYTTGRLLLGEKQIDEGSVAEAAFSRAAQELGNKLKLLERERKLCLLHVQLFFNTFARLCPAELGVELRRSGIASSSDKCRWLDQTISSVNDECDEGDPENHLSLPVSEVHAAAVPGSSTLPSSDVNKSCSAAGSPMSELLTKIGSAVKACEALRHFSCAAISSMPPPPALAYTEAAAANAASPNIPGDSSIEAMEVEGQTPVERAEESTVAFQGSHGRPVHALPRKFQAALDEACNAAKLLLQRSGKSFSFDDNSRPLLRSASSALSVLPCEFPVSTIDQKPYDTSDVLSLDPFAQMLRLWLHEPEQQAALFHGLHHESASVKEETFDLLASFSRQTAALLPHHKLATSRTEAADPNSSIPKDWLDLAAVARSYKVAVTGSQQSTAPHAVDPPASICGDSEVQVPAGARLVNVRGSCDAQMDAVSGNQLIRNTGIGGTTERHSADAHGISATYPDRGVAPAAKREAFNRRTSTPTKLGLGRSCSDDGSLPQSSIPSLTRVGSHPRSTATRGSTGSARSSREPSAPQQRGTRIVTNSEGLLAGQHNVQVLSPCGSGDRGSKKTPLWLARASLRQSKPGTLSRSSFGCTEDTTL